METAPDMKNAFTATNEAMGRNEKVNQQIQSVAAVAEQTSASTQQVAATTEEMTAATQEVAAIAENLQHISSELIKNISVFKV
jgi:methyl-accepting chemotaxis protein